MLTAREFRAAAITLVGLPYVLGAEWKDLTKLPKAVDCSELVEGLFAKNGTPIGDLAAAQYDKTRALEYGEKPTVGDLVFLKNNPARWNRIGHVAVITAKLSTGDYEIVEARGRKYGVVRSTLSYWKTRKYFTGVRRYPAFKLASEPSEDRLFRLVWANRQAQLWQGMADDSPIPGREIKLLKPSIVAGCEFSEKARNETRRVFGPSWVTWPVGYVWVTWTKNLWTAVGHKEIGYGTDYHGAVRVTLQSLKSNNRTMDVIAMHVRPADSYPGKSDEYILDAKRDLIAKTLVELHRGAPTIIVGDFATSKVDDLFGKLGYARATPNVDTYDKGGKIDSGWINKQLVMRKTTLHDPGNVSDHKWWLMQGTLPGNPT